MMETLLVFLLTGYGVWLAAYLLWEKSQRKRPTTQAKVPPPTRPDDVPDIVGKSSFRMKPTTPNDAKPTPQAATKSGNEKPIGNVPTFAPETRNTPSARIPDDKLDEAFEHLEIPDVPLEYEDDDQPEEAMDEEMPLAAGHAGYASGASFEEIDRAVKTAADTSATEAERRQAGQVFGRIEGTELFDRLVNSSTSVGEKIAGLMDYYLSQPLSNDADAGTVALQLPNGTDVPEEVAGFDIRDFV